MCENSGQGKLKPISTNVPLLYPPENIRKHLFFHVFMGYRGSAVVEKLISIYILEKKLVSRQFTYFFSKKKTVFIKKLHANIEINGIQY